MCKGVCSLKSASFCRKMIIANGSMEFYSTRWLLPPTALPRRVGRGLFLRRSNFKDGRSF